MLEYWKNINKENIVLSVSVKFSIDSSSIILSNIIDECDSR